MKNYRSILLVIIILLVCIGTIMVYSSSAIYSYESNQDSEYFLKRHLLYIFLGSIIFFLTLILPYKKIKKYLPILIFFTYTFLFMVLIPNIGIEVGGARRWLNIGFFQFQPSEIAKLVFIIYLADFVSRKGMLLNSFLKGFLPPVLVCFSLSALILLQPDLGNAIFLITLTLLILFIAGGRLKYFLVVLLSSIPFAIYFILGTSYRRERIIAFLNPWTNARDIGFQLVQSYLAFGTGGIFGVGLGKSKQKLFYLPASHTDFIFSIIGEELGFLGAGIVLILFFLFLVIGLKIVLKKTDVFARILGLGIIFNISLQAILNMAVTTGLVPTKGLPLPFISYGGTNLIISIVQIGLLFNISKNAP